MNKKPLNLEKTASSVLNVRLFIHEFELQFREVIPDVIKTGK